LRAGNFEALDLENLAEEIKEVGKSEKRELMSRMVVLLAHLLKWQFQPLLRGKSRKSTIIVQRDDVADVLEEAPSLRASLEDSKWLEKAWRKARLLAANETGIDEDLFPSQCPWRMAQALDPEFFPEQAE
jgi:hypothetical protein